MEFCVAAEPETTLGAIRNFWWTKSVGFASVEMVVKSSKQAAMFNLSACKWMGDQLQISELSSNEYIQNT
jgi:hypothetical protein